MIKGTWQEEPEKRPSFTDIVQFFHEQNVEYTPVDEAENITIDSKSDNGYLNISNA